MIAAYTYLKNLNFKTPSIRALHIWLVLLCGCFASAANAIAPESGWWWNASESGRGFSIEIQDNTLFMAGFLYDESGAPFWFTSSGRFNASASSFQADMQSFRGGQCFNCPYRLPIASAPIGQLRLTFTSATEGSLTWPFGTVPITRQIYGVGAGIDRLLGSFAFSSSGSSGRVNFGNWLRFNRVTNNASLGSVAEGATEAGRVVVATLTADRRTAIILIDASTSLYELYVVPLSFFGTRGGTGLWTTYFKTATAPQPNALAHFSRILSSAEIGAAGASANLPELKQLPPSNAALESQLRSEALIQSEAAELAEINVLQQQLLKVVKSKAQALIRHD